MSTLNEPLRLHREWKTKAFARAQASTQRIRTARF